MSPASTRIYWTAECFSLKLFDPFHSVSMCLMFEIMSVKGQLKHTHLLSPRQTLTGTVTVTSSMECVTQSFSFTASPDLWSVTISNQLLLGSHPSIRSLFSSSPLLPSQFDL